MNNKELTKTGLDVTNYIRPHGKKEVITIFNIYENDCEFLRRNNIKVSMEDIEIDFAIYFDHGIIIDDEPDELIILAQKRTCQDTIRDAVEQIKKIHPEFN